MSVAEKCLHFSMTECSRGRRRRQKRVNISVGEIPLLAVRCSAQKLQNPQTVICGKGDFMPEIEQNKNEFSESVIRDIAKEFNVIANFVRIF